jgi:hypothetical protein
MDNENKVKNRRKLGFNAIDALIIVLVLAAIVGLVLRYTVLSGIENASAHDTYYITFKSAEITQSSCDALDRTAKDADGENWVYLQGGTVRVGELTAGSVTYLPSETLVEDENGNKVVIHYPDLFDATGMIKCKGYVASETGAFRLNGKLDLAAGSVLEVQTKYGDFVIEIKGIEPALEVE